MSDRDWLLSVAVGGIALGLFLFAVSKIWESNRAREHQYSYPERRCAEQQERRFSEPSTLSREPIEAPAPNDGSPKQEQQKGSEPDWCDLTAQESMAQSTRGMETSAWISIAIGAVGLVMLGMTVHYTRHTLSEARRSADAAVIASNAAARAIDIQARGEGPFLHAQEIVTLLGSDMIHPVIRNSGKSPAILIRYSAQCTVGDCELVGVPVYEAPISADETLLEPQKTHPLFCNAGLPANNVAMLWGYVDYTDVFGNLRRLGFGFACRHWFGTWEGDGNRQATEIRSPMWMRNGGTAYNYDRPEPGQ